MKGLLIKNFKLYLKQYTVFILILLLFIFIPQSNMMGMVFVYNMIFVSGMITNDESTKWNIIEKYMPIREKDIVLSKYMVIYIFTLGEILLIGISYLLNTYILNNPFSTNNIAFTLLASLIMTAFMIPTIIWFGAEKGRIVMGVLLGIILCIASIFVFSVNIACKINNSNSFITYITLAALILNVLSILLSIKLYKSRRYKI